MYIYISPTRGQLLDNLVNKHGIHITKVNTSSLLDFLMHNKELSHYKKIIIDMVNLKDTPSEFSSAINKLRYIASDVSIVIIADKEDLQEDTLRRIRAMGVSDIILKLEMLEECILMGNTQEKLSEMVNSIKEEKNERNRDNNSHIDSSAIDSGVCNTEIKQELANEHIENTDVINSSNTRRTDNQRMEKALENERADENKHVYTTHIYKANSDFKKYKDSIHIAVISAQSRIGVTHVAIQMTKFLKELGFKVCYSEPIYQSDSPIVAIKNTENTNYNHRTPVIQYKGIDLCSDNLFNEIHEGKYEEMGWEDLPQVNRCYKTTKDYDICVYDLSAFNLSYMTEEGVKNEIKRLTMWADLYDGKWFDDIIFLCGSKPWELPDTKKLLHFANLSKDKILFNFTQPNDKNKLSDKLNIPIGKINILNHAPDPFEVGDNKKVYAELLNHYVKKEQHSIPSTHRKKSLFRKGN